MFHRLLENISMQNITHKKVKQAYYEVERKMNHFYAAILQIQLYS